MRYLTLIWLIALPAFAQLATPPSQPLLGPGGKDYLYPSYQKFGPFYVDIDQPEPYTEFYVYEPAGGTAPAALPVVLFLHGYLLPGEGYPLGDSPENYAYWLIHLARMGYTVVFPDYDYKQQPVNFTGNIIEIWGSALKLLSSGASGFIPPAVDSQGVQTVFAGHSMGAFQCFSVAQQLTVDPIAGIPLPRAIGGFSPGLGQSGLSANFPLIASSIRVVIAHGDEDTNNTATVLDIWNSIEPVIPAANRDLLLVNTDSYGSPAQIGNHYYPDTNGYNDDDSGVDDRDYNVTWKLSVGLFNCVLYGTDCTYGLGHGANDQINMGKWSDGTPVLTLTLQDSE